MLETVTLNALSSALDGLSARQTAIADNVANINTPDYRAKVINFEDELTRSVARGDGRVVAKQETSLQPTQLNGNNVNLNEETLSNMSTVLKFQFAAQAAKQQFSEIRDVLKGT
ncbi:flagellar basal body rod protein FlgB [Curtobacterium sp. MCSS17_016]|uniref:flagellar basal body rod protein FlgB n=1 Tax=Curtobacterium sp. MCSS17_016 TaxID=2175644 RepID=UPI000DA70A80|nr:flagellar basal body rod protein FlgB [Curtobacterium sp. MCSS17_016]WIE80916.1 flagellar basal body rod protein FlgB [Curtobacterium sp. MCSS17_016]